MLEINVAQRGKLSKVGVGGVSHSTQPWVLGTK